MFTKIRLQTHKRCRFDEKGGKKIKEVHVNPLDSSLFGGKFGLNLVHIYNIVRVRQELPTDYM